MIAIVVNIEVSSDKIQDFIEATKKAREATLKEPGCKQYDIIQLDPEDFPKSGHFILVEEYTSEEAFKAHKETSHFHNWRTIVNKFTIRSSMKGSKI